MNFKPLTCYPARSPRGHHSRNPNCKRHVLQSANLFPQLSGGTRTPTIYTIGHLSHTAVSLHPPSLASARAAISTLNTWSGRPHTRDALFSTRGSFLLPVPTIIDFNGFRCRAESVSLSCLSSLASFRSRGGSQAYAEVEPTNMRANSPANW